jgi:hypothetical protein
VRLGVIASAFLAGLAWSGAAIASDLPSKSAPPPPPVAAPASGWKFQFTAYGWLTAINGDVGMRYRQPVPVDVSVDQVLNNLKGVFMGAFQAKNDTWMFLVDAVWSELGAKRTNRFGGQLDFTQQLGMVEGYVGYRIPVGGPNFDLRGMVGVRGQQLKATVTHFGVLPALDRSFTGDKGWVDPVVGVSLTYDFNKNWFLNAVGDVGGFGVGSKFTTQGLVAVGYRWTDNISTSIGYRALYTDYDKRGTVYKTTLHGIFMGLGVSF